MKDIAKMVKDARKKSGLSQREVAERAGCHQTLISHVEHGRVKPSVFMLSKILKACGGRLKLVVER